MFLTPKLSIITKMTSKTFKNCPNTLGHKNAFLIVCAQIKYFPLKIIKLMILLSNFRVIKHLCPFERDKIFCKRELQN